MVGHLYVKKVCFSKACVLNIVDGSVLTYDATSECSRFKTCNLASNKCIKVFCFLKCISDSIQVQLLTRLPLYNYLFTRLGVVNLKAGEMYNKTFVTRYLLSQ